MENITKVYVGVDVSKNRLDIHVYPITKTFFVDNTEDGINTLMAHLSSYSVEQIVCESTGGYEDLMLKKLHNAGYKVWQVEPNRIKSFIRTKGRKAKTDTIDAYMIALFAAQEKQEHAYVEYGVEHDVIHDLVTRRKDLTAMIITETSRFKHPSQALCKAEIQAHIDFMNKQLKEIDAKIQDHIDKNDDLKGKSKIIESMPGVGKVSSAMLIAEMPELGKIENKKIAALLGVAPYIQQSGQSKGTAFISGGRTMVRSVIYMAALVATRRNPKMKAFYQKLKAAGKKPKIALVAVMRKMIVILNVMVKNNTMWCHGV